MDWNERLERRSPFWAPLISRMFSFRQHLNEFPRDNIKEPVSFVFPLSIGLSGSRWRELLEILSSPEPLGDDQQRLTVKPFLFHLPVPLQKRLLQFIYEHFDEVPSSFLEQLLSVLLERDSPTDKWILFFQSLLQSRLIERKRTGLGISGEQKPSEQSLNPYSSSSSTEYQFAESNKLNFSSVCGYLIKSEDQTNSTPDVCFANDTNFENYFKNCQSRIQDSQNQEMEVNGQKGQSDQLTTELAILCEATQPSNGESIEECQTMDVVQVTDNQPLHLDDSLQRALMVLRESWISQRKLDSECFVVMTRLSPLQLEVVLRQLSVLKSVSDASVLLACQTVVECTSKQITHRSVVLFANTFLLAQIQLLEQHASRVFAAAVVEFVRAFPSQSVEGLFQALLSHPFCGLSQCELVVKVIGEVVNAQFWAELLRILVEGELTVWPIQMLSVVQALIDTKFGFPLDHLKRLLSFIELNSSSNSSNLKFGRLLLSFVQVYGKLLTSVEVNSVVQMANEHKTFMTRSIRSALTRL